MAVRAKNADQSKPLLVAARISGPVAGVRELGDLFLNAAGETGGVAVVMRNMVANEGQITRTAEFSLRFPSEAAFSKFGKECLNKVAAEIVEGTRKLRMGRSENENELRLFIYLPVPRVRRGAAKTAEAA